MRVRKTCFSTIHIAKTQILYLCAERTDAEGRQSIAVATVSMGHFGKLNGHAAGQGVDLGYPLGIEAVIPAHVELH